MTLLDQAVLPPDVVEGGTQNPYGQPNAITFVATCRMKAHTHLAGPTRTRNVAMGSCYHDTRLPESALYISTPMVGILPTFETVLPGSRARLVRTHRAVAHRDALPGM